jgi:hypothetical protein
MALISCRHKDCNRIFKKPVIVTNFSFTPKKETYSACPYCLTRISYKSKDCNQTLIIVEKPANNENVELYEAKLKPQFFQEYSMNKESYPPLRSVSFDYVGSGDITFENIKNLEKRKADLLAEINKLRIGATVKINHLEEDVAALREEVQLLKKLVKN